ncbi:hypothetical protein [Novipirellula artificiosorum]|jgi:hypothetical protein|uniref:Uncharacterized protein n=1 Tax=Novipirellula artificiosorum TaxID=2528016 RepID=A0A5C6D1L0_9BACT|nr:hypothetical protein [Novipirellula artificiosorum]TWU30720.1 hypothetical protein Poly41_66250 [Novipirellula artificiosorum]
MQNRSLNLLVFAVLLFAAPTSAVAQELYFPSSDRDWATVTPESLGWDMAALEEVFKLVEPHWRTRYLVELGQRLLNEKLPHQCLPGSVL